MTPLVDLGFLLISFFVITTEMSRPFTTDLYMPKLEGRSTTLGESDALTFLLTKDNTIYYYHGDWEKALQNSRVFKTSIHQKPELRKLISDKQHYLDRYNKKEGRKGLMLLIKPDKYAAYGNIIDILDEVLIQDLRKYAVLPLQAGEKEFLEQLLP